MSVPSFKNSLLRTTALTHRSALNEHLSEASESNERLEYLGDAVLELVVSEELYTLYPHEQEGMLTALRSALVKTTTLAEVAQELGLGEELFMSKGEEATGGRQNTSLLANTVEALIGALYLDQGYEAVQQFLKKNLLPKVTHIYKNRLYKDPKSNLQELLQAKGFTAPEYVVVEELGPEHDREFVVEARVNGKSLIQGRGRSKQLAQQHAAEQLVRDQSWLTAGDFAQTPGA